MKSETEKSMGDLANDAFERVVDKVIKRASDAGSTVFMAKDGRMVALDPEEARLEANKKKKPSDSQ